MERPYTYRVRAVNSAGAGAWSAMFNGTTNAAAPDKMMLRARAEGQNVVLSWDTPDDNGASIMRYEIQRFPSIDDEGNVENDWGDDLEEGDGRDGLTGTVETELDDEASGDDVIVPMPVGVTTYTDMGLMPGTTYYYHIRAVNGQNSGLEDAARIWSTEVQVTTAPKAPDKMTLTLAGGDQKVTLTWDAPANNGSAISEYQIERWDSAARMWATIKEELPSSVTSYEDGGLMVGTRYFYRIRAVNAGGDGAWSTLTSEETDAAAE